MESDFVDLLNKEMYELALAIYQNVKQENQALKDRWDRLEQFVWEQLNNEIFDKYKAYDEMFSKMKELEKEIK